MSDKERALQSDKMQLIFSDKNTVYPFVAPQDKYLFYAAAASLGANSALDYGVATKCR